ncbi:hypothetical protein MAR_015408, partial [Mya arenaria]
ASLFREFLGENCGFEGFSSEELNKSLRAFFASIRKTDGSELKKSSLTSIKYGILCNDNSFSSCLTKFKSKVTDLKKGSENIAIDIDTPCGLQKKVWFEIMDFLCRRGQDNLRGMKKRHICRRCQCCRAESSCDETIGEGKMYELPGDVNCPVASLEKYLSKLHPQIDWLWQRPLDSFEMMDQ